MSRAREIRFVIPTEDDNPTGNRCPRPPRDFRSERMEFFFNFSFFFRGLLGFFAIVRSFLVLDLIDRRRR